MSKAVLVMDIPENCQDCPLKHDYYCEADEEKRDAYFHEIPEWCPLVPLPEKKEVCGRYPQEDGMTPSYKIGWNACIDAITGNSQP